MGGLFQQMKSRNEGKDSNHLNKTHEDLVKAIYGTRKEVEFS